MSKPIETRSPCLPGIPAPQMLWSTLPSCRCGGTGVMPIIGWPGRTIICACGAGKHIAASSTLKPGDFGWS